MKLPEHMIQHVSSPAYAYAALGLFCSSLVMLLLNLFGFGISWVIVLAPILMPIVSFIIGVLLLLVIIALGAIIFLIVCLGAIMTDIPLLMLVSTLYNIGLIKELEVDTNFANFVKNETKNKNEKEE